jgi:hypothetical protein
MLIAPWPSKVGGPGFEREPVRLLKPQLGRVLDRDHALARVDQLRQALSMVVLPEPVPPEMITFIREAPAILSRSPSCPTAIPSPSSCRW